MAAPTGKKPDDLPTDRWERMQQAADELLAPNPKFERGIPALTGQKSASEGLAQLAVLEKWMRIQIEGQAGDAPSNATAAPLPPAAPTQPLPRSNPTASRPTEPAFLNADPRLRAALNRIQEKTVEAAKGRMRLGSKLVRPGLPGFSRDEVPVIDNSDIKENPTDSKWVKSTPNTTRILRAEES
jgi:hypothetical protein